MHLRCRFLPIRRLRPCWKMSLWGRPTKSIFWLFEFCRSFFSFKFGHIIFFDLFFRLCPILSPRLVDESFEFPMSSLLFSIYARYWYSLFVSPAWRASRVALISLHIAWNMKFTKFEELSVTFPESAFVILHFTVSRVLIQVYLQMICSLYLKLYMRT